LGIGLFSSPVRDDIRNALKLGIAYDTNTSQELGFGSFLEFFASMPMNLFGKKTIRYPVNAPRPTGARVGPL